MVTTYSVVLRGVKPGFSAVEPTQRLASLLKIPSDQAEMLLANSNLTVKSGVDLPTATKYESAIQNCGCMVSIRKEPIEEPLEFDLPDSIQTPTQALIGCKACSKNISVLADKCPACGAPNDWVHPDVTKFINNDNIDTSERFTYRWNKAEVWGQTGTKVPTRVMVIGVLIFLAIYFPLGFFGSFGFLFGPINIFIVIGFGFVFGLILTAMYGERKTFHANLLDRTWTSSADQFWYPIKAFLDL